MLKNVTKKPNKNKNVQGICSGNGPKDKSGHTSTNADPTQACGGGAGVGGGGGRGGGGSGVGGVSAVTAAARAGAW